MEEQRGDRESDGGIGRVGREVMRSCKGKVKVGGNVTGGGGLEGERRGEKADEQKEERKEEERNSEAAEDRKHLPLNRD